MRILKKIEEEFEEWIMVALLVGIGVIMFIQVILRYIFDSPLMWAEEISRYMFVWTSFISIGYSFRRDILLKVDILYDKFTPVIKKIVEFLTIILTLLFLGIMCIRSTNVVNQIAASGQLSPSLQLPMQYVYASSTVGFFLGLIRYIQFIFRKYVFKTIKNKDRLETTTN